MTGDGTGNLTGAATTYFAGTPLTTPFSLTVDSAGTLFIGDLPNSGNGVIYSLALGGTTLTPLSFTGIPTRFSPASLFLGPRKESFTSRTTAHWPDPPQAAYMSPQPLAENAQTIPTYSFSIIYPPRVSGWMRRATSIS